jgi:hypothetical protein
VAHRKIDDAALETLRQLEPRQALDALGLYWKTDPSFVPVKDASTVRLHVTVGASVVELLVTGVRWFDPRRGRGGGGAIDLAMHLLAVDFRAAVAKLRGSAERRRNGGTREQEEAERR